MKNDATIGAIIRKSLPKLLIKQGISKHQLKTLRALGNCRTPELGGSVMSCNNCGTMHYVRHSCRNRHCPCCQGIDKEIWIENVSNDLLPVKYFHVVFTVPHELLEVFRFNKKTMYNLLFEKAWGTIKHFAAKTKYMGASPGAIAVLHTWDQQMNYHPHLHFIVPGGGIDKNGNWKETSGKDNFFIDVRQMSSKFSGSFVSKLRKLKQQGKIKKFIPRDLISKPWVVYAKKAFGSPKSVVEYLGRYTHRVAISNARIVKITENHVTFTWLNRKNGYKKETTTLTGEGFLKRFIEHIVPPCFRRIRHLGFLSSRNKALALETIRKSLGIEHTPCPKISRSQILEMEFGEHSILQCKECGGKLVVIETYPSKRAPPKHKITEE